MSRRRSRRVKPSQAIIVALALLAAGGGARADDLRWQGWWDAGLRYWDGNPKYAALLNVHARVSEGGDVNTWNTEASLFFRTGEHFEWGEGFKFQQDRLPGTAFDSEVRFLVYATGRWGTAPGWQAAVRTLNEVRRRNDQVWWRFRLRPGLKRGLGGPWSLVASNELFYDNRAERYNQNRALVGLEHRARKGEEHDLATQVYFMIRSDRILGEWLETYVVGLAWMVR